MTDGAEPWPHTREAVRETYEQMHWVAHVGSTTSGLLLDLDPGANRHSTIGNLITDRGWAVDYIDFEDCDVHISPLPEGSA